MDSIGWIVNTFKNSYWTSLQIVYIGIKNGLKNEMIKLNVKSFFEKP
jgi:hypothetical protein